MAAYHRMIAETDPTQREGALIAFPPYEIENGRRPVPTAATSQGKTTLTICTMRLRGQLRSILKNMDSYSAACLEELADLMTLWNVEPRLIAARVAEALAAATMTNTASTQEETNPRP
ncbi:hypothetical protein Tco_1330588, partial [Tanacetum coccineum]